MCIERANLIYSFCLVCDRCVFTVAALATTDNTGEAPFLRTAGPARMIGAAESEGYSHMYACSLAIN